MVPLDDLETVDGGIIAHRTGGCLTFIDTSSARPLEIVSDGEK